MNAVESTHKHIIGLWFHVVNDPCHVKFDGRSFSHAVSVFQKLVGSQLKKGTQDKCENLLIFRDIAQRTFLW